MEETASQLKRAHSASVPAAKVTARRAASAERASWNDLSALRYRDRDRVVTLPRIASQLGLREEELEEGDEEESTAQESLLRTTLEDDRLQLPMPPPQAAGRDRQAYRGRITTTTACDAYDLGQVISAVADALPYSTCTYHPECLHISAQWVRGHSPHVRDVFVFDYGVVVCWDLDALQEHAVNRLLKPCQVRPVPPQEVQSEVLGFQYTALDQQPNISNDCITLSRREARDVFVKMAVSHALAQSSKLGLYEDRLEALVQEVRPLPESLARHGEIRMNRKTMAQIQGKVFINHSQLNLLSSVLDVPDLFWTASDALRSLYDKVNEYCETDLRAKLVNDRLKLIKRMLALWSDHSSHHHGSSLDIVVVVLILIEVLVAAAQVVGMLEHKRR